MRYRALLAWGMAMPLLYALTLGLARLLNPGFDIVRRAPSDLGRATAAHPLVYDLGMVATAGAGLLAGVGLVAASRRVGRGAPWGFAAGLSIVLASVGLAMAGLFPLPSHVHDGFGLTGAAALTPLLGAMSLWRLADRGAAALLVVAFVSIVSIVVAGAPPLMPGSLMLATIVYLGWRSRRAARDLRYAR